MYEFLTSGTLLGLAAGFSPGPLLVMVISQTLRHNIKEGIKVSCAPLLTDLPVILLTVFLFMKLPDFKPLLGVISIAGGLFVLYLGYESLCTKGTQINLSQVEPKSLKKGAIVNLLSPHPYLFWFSIGTPTIMKAIQVSPAAPAVFVGSFYIFLVGSKVVLALLVGRSIKFMEGNIYIYTMRFLGLSLILLSFMLFKEGYAYFQIA